MKNWIKRNRFRLAIIISLLLHFLLFGLAILLTNYPINIPLFAAEEPVVQQPEPTQPFVFDLMETPESARINNRPANAEHVSDKNARAQNESADENLPLDKAFSDGDIDIPQAEEILGALAQASQQSQMQQENSEQPAEEKQPQEIGRTTPTVQSSASQFSRDMITGGPQRQSEQPIGSSSITRSAYDNTDSRAPDMGMFSLNTYEWDFAPYLLKMKRKIEEHIFPPAAFTRMGIISGKSMIKFRIDREGKQISVEVVRYDGHSSLMKTSKKAVEVSMPFDKLPDNFPEEYLEVTAIFEYRIH